MKNPQKMKHCTIISVLLHLLHLRPQLAAGGVDVVAFAPAQRNGVGALAHASEKSLDALEARPLKHGRHGQARTVDLVVLFLVALVN